MTYQFGQILVPFIAVMVNVVIQILSCRILFKMVYKNYQRSLKVSVAFGIFSGVAYVVAQEIIIFSLIFSNFEEEAVSMIFINLLIYLAFSYWYVVYITFGETSLRTRILMEIDKRGELSEQEILARYNTQELIKIRMARLVNTKQVIFREGRYFGKDSVLVNWAKGLGYMHLAVFGHKGDYQ
tara:strand:- start:2362 stop:2910 length:549 start_codon:yes stop_codon:yes gene_type:complete